MLLNTSKIPQYTDKLNPNNNLQISKYTETYVFSIILNEIYAPQFK